MSTNNDISFMAGQEITLADIGEKVNGLTQTVADLVVVVRGNTEAIEDLERTTKEEFDIVGKRFDGIEGDIGQLKSDVGYLKSDVGYLKSDVGQLKTDVGYLKSQMVTKDYLDKKVAELSGHFVELLRKEDNRLSRLISFMKERTLLTLAEVKQLDILKPLVAID